MFVYQAESLGTGHAAQVAVRALEARGYEGPVALMMGDKVAVPTVARRLIRAFGGARADVVLTTLPRTGETTAGRVVVDPTGRVLGIVETADL